MRRDFSVSNIYASPYLILITKGMGVPIGEGKPNATSTAASEETGGEFLTITIDTFLKR